MKLVRVAVCLVLLSLVAACVSVPLQTPGPENQAVLILPFQVTNKSRFGNPGFKYSYEIINAESKEKFNVDFRLTDKTGYVMMKNLPPGSFTVSEYFIRPVGPGSKTYNDQGRPVHKYLTLAYGHITIFEHSLNASIRHYAIDSSDGRVIYQVEISPMTVSQKAAILESLGKDPDFNAWKMANE